jgi:hypothetical protein
MSKQLETSSHPNLEHADQSMIRLAVPFFHTLPPLLRSVSSMTSSNTFGTSLLWGPEAGKEAGLTGFVLTGFRVLDFVSATSSSFYLLRLWFS